MTNRTVSPRLRHVTVLSAVALGLMATMFAIVPVRAASSVELQLRALVGGRYEVGGWASVAVTLV